jgi:hypothetical protein
MTMDYALSIASWVVAVLAFLAFIGLAGYGVALRRTARRDGGPLGPRRGQEAGVLTVLAVALALGTQIFFVPFYMRAAVGRAVRATLVGTRESGTRTRIYTLLATYEDPSGKVQAIEDNVSRDTYGRYSPVPIDCTIERELAKVGHLVPELKPSGRCEPVPFVVVDGLPGLAQYGTEPLVHEGGIAITWVLFGMLLVGMIHQGQSRKGT